LLHLGIQSQINAVFAEDLLHGLRDIGTMLGASYLAGG